MIKNSMRKVSNMDVSLKLAKLILDNPDLPVMIFAENNADLDYDYSANKLRDCEIDKLYIRLALDRSEIVNCEILKRYNFNEDTIETKNAYWDEFFRYRGYDEIGPKLEDWIKNDPDVFTKFLKEETDYYAVEYSGLTDSQKELLDILIQSLSIEELNTYKKLTMISKSLFGNDHKTSINIIQQYINKQN